MILQIHFNLNVPVAEYQKMAILSRMPFSLCLDTEWITLNAVHNYVL